jgi:glycosyltransferase involved in cell wall biosynthesis
LENPLQFRPHEQPESQRKVRFWQSEPAAMNSESGLPRVLMIAYACDPKGNGEHWLGWGWAEQAAAKFSVDLITTPKSREAVEQSCIPLGISPHFVPVPEWIRSVTESAGGAWWRKIAWQRRAFAVAKFLHREKKFQVVHQTTFHTFRTPFLSTRLGIPSVWGPIAGGERVPPGFGRYLGASRFSEWTRNAANCVSLYAPSIQRSLRQTSVLFVSNRTTLAFLPESCRARCRIVPPNALRPEEENMAAVQPPVRQGEDARVRLVYVGNCVATRAIPLVLEALARPEVTDARLTVVGEGPALNDWKRRSIELRLNDRVQFAGRVPRQQLDSYYGSADALVFPALRDSGGSALLEAMARGLPVICLDWGGPGEVVDEKSGIKIPVTTPGVTVEALARAIVQIGAEPGIGPALGRAAQARARELFGWRAKQDLLVSTYGSLIAA